MNYIDQGGTLPVPFNVVPNVSVPWYRCFGTVNVVPTPKSCRYAWRWLRSLCQCNNDDDDDDVRNCKCSDQFVDNEHTFIDVTFADRSLH